ncbi:MULTISPECIES: F510_1955 family glycosylhydrolase [unclassified Streptomyces]|uniref:F510_1955 family glycosylhydrolase n=1 Tax=unclassified Streptomyces TaxID=2593676 RepID=UPI001654C3DB|nr:exo-alpha-sialidase [Streptomyces sp. CB02980]MCB8901751.1 exo-alpha-sialidase [Streptomyces sp. CB02980]
MTKHFTRPAATAAALTLSLALALAACSTSGESDGESSGGRAPGAGSAAALSHIHGIGLRGDSLYVATHQGVYTPDADGSPIPVGDRRDDFMGFTVTADGDFLASGHPAPGADGPADLGLVASTDSGRTWREKSLAGKVDFHALDTARDSTVYGYDSANGLLRVSADGVTWDDRAALRALDIAVSPADPATVLASTESGVARSTDGGRTFAPGAGRVLAYLSWGAPDALFGVDPDGVLFRGTGGGAGWTRVSTVPGGAPQALTVVDARRLFVATGDGVYASRDAGRTFERRMAVKAAGGGH